MFAPATHIIQRQTVRLHLREQTDSWPMQERVGRALQQSGLLAALDAVLSAFGLADEWIELERVEVALGAMSPDDVEDEIARRLPDLLRRQLRNVIPQTRYQQATDYEPKPSVRNAEAVIFETFVYFLQTGSLPPTTLWPESDRAFDEQVQAALPNLTYAQKERLTTLLAYPIPRLRLLHQFSEATLAVVLSAVSVGHISVSIRLLHRLQAWREKLPAGQYESLRMALLKNVILESETVLQTLENHWTTIDPSALAFPSTIDALLSDKPEPTDFELDKTHRTYLNSAISTENQAEPEPDAEPPAETVFYVRNAGVVLLHDPFLPVCFEACGWVENGAFKDDTCRKKALLMIHFLATGQRSAAEYDLVLPKVLCNLPWNWPITRQFTLTESEQEEGTALLNEVIRRWEALGNTSPDGLREGFLQREGKLERLTGNQWLLTIEVKAQDYLLNKLTHRVDTGDAANTEEKAGWRISPVILPWLKKWMLVRWAYPVMP